MGCSERKPSMVLIGFGRRVETSSSASDDAQPVQAAAKRSAVKAIQNVWALQ